MLYRENELVDYNLKQSVKSCERSFVKYKSIESININNFSYKNIKCTREGKESNHKALDSGYFFPKNIGKIFIILFRSKYTIWINDKNKRGFVNIIDKKALQ